MTATQPVPRSPRAALAAMTAFRPLVSILIVALLGCGAPDSSPGTDPGPSPMPDPAPAAVTPPAGTPRLLLFLVVDQGGYDQLIRFRPLFRHGLARLLDESVSFTAMHHDHAPTETAPGHATLATGRLPAHHGIVANDWYDRETHTWVEAVDDPVDGTSPRALEASALGDWLQETYPDAKVFTVSSKDRAAVFTGGLHPDGAFWLDRDTGRFETSSYYAESLPAWLVAFHDERWIDGFFGTAWELLPETREVLEEGTYGIVELPPGAVPQRFPHRRGTAALSPGEAFYDSVYASPLADAYIGRMATALLAGEGLGRDEVPDFLGISFSSTDVIGHRYGPDSPEILDTLLELDRTLGELLDAVDRSVGLDHTLVSLSADHGVLANPELLQQQGKHPEAGRFGTAEILCLQRAALAVEKELGHGRWTAQGFYLDRNALAAAGLDREVVETRLARGLESCPRIARVWTEAELARAPAAGEDPIGALYRHGFDPERSPDLTIQETPFTMTHPTVVASHGSPYDYDTHVPWLVRLPRGVPGSVETPARTIDVAPTLAGLLGVALPTDVDGADRGAVLAAASEAP